MSLQVAPNEVTHHGGTSDSMGIKSGATGCCSQSILHDWRPATVRSTVLCASECEFRPRDCGGDHPHCNNQETLEVPLHWECEPYSLECWFMDWELLGLFCATPSQDYSASGVFVGRRDSCELGVTILVAPVGKFSSIAIARLDCRGDPFWWHRRENS